MTNNEMIRKMENNVRLRGLSSQTLEEYISRARFFLSYIRSKSLEDCDVKIVRRLPDIMTREQIEIHFDACNNLRDRAILMTVYGGGLRLSEVCNLKGEDIYASSMCNC